MCAYVIPRDGESLTLQQLAAYLLEQEISKHKLPERLEVVDEFPLSPFGKVSKKDLTERITQLLKLEERS
jgi:2,3-dihydroxybenzoate-AMP ligase